MKYVIEDENHQIVKTVEAEDIFEVCDELDENGENQFNMFSPGEANEHAYNGELYIRRVRID
jgi:hypothetical protein